MLPLSIEPFHSDTTCDNTLDTAEYTDFTSCKPPNLIVCVADVITERTNRSKLVRGEFLNHRQEEYPQEPNLLQSHANDPKPDSLRLQHHEAVVAITTIEASTSRKRLVKLPGQSCVWRKRRIRCAPNPSDLSGGFLWTQADIRTSTDRHAFQHNTKDIGIPRRSQYRLQRPDHLLRISVRPRRYGASRISGYPLRVPAHLGRTLSRLLRDQTPPKPTSTRALATLTSTHITRAQMGPT